jgi:hypothetical protein
MDHAQRLLSSTRAWPWGLVIISDPRSRSELPAHLDERGVAAAVDAVAVGIQHEVDGEAVAEIWVGSHTADLRCIYDEEFTTSHGAVVLGAADDSWCASARIGEGTHRLRILVDKVGDPELVLFELSDS